MLRKFIIFIFLLFLILLPQKVQAVENFEEMLEGQVVNIYDQKEIELMGQSQIYQKLEIEIEKGSLAGETIQVENGNLPTIKQNVYKQGDRLIISHSKYGEGEEQFFVADYVRRDSLLGLFLLFVVIAIFVGKWRGVQSIAGMAVSFLIIFLIILPMISAGKSPIGTALFGAFLMVPTTFYISHGLNKKTTVSIIGTFISLIITVLLASIFVGAAKLSGFSSEDAMFLQNTTAGTINIQGLLLAGIIIGAVGILDDITLAQTSVVFKLKETAKNIKISQLYKKSMEVGQDHISSMVNTLVLVYAGAYLPLLLLFADSSRTFSEVINYEMVAEEIIKTLVGSIGLITAVPITTFIACFVVSKKDK
jgi:uncharacterized membrane protein